MLAEFTGSSSWAIEVLAVPVLFFVMVALGRGLKRHSGVALGVFYLLFCATFALWLPLEFFSGDFPHRLDLLRALRAANVLLGTGSVVALIRRYFWELWFERHQKARAPKFLSQLLGLMMVIVAIFFVIGGIYGQSIEGVVFGSTVVGGIVGFAMQDLLGNLIAGIALELGKPFRIADWLIFDDVRAEVMEVNWRSTRLRTTDDVYLDIPNKAIVGARIVNLTQPFRQHAIRIIVHFDVETPPNLVKDVLAQAAREVAGVLAMPAPAVFLKDFGDSSVNYEIKFWIEDESRFNNILDGIRTNVWYAAQRHGLRMPFPIRTLHIERPGRKPEDGLASARASVHKQPILQLLDDSQVERLLAHARLLRFGRGEKVIEQGAAGESMFVLLSGEAEVFIRNGDRETLMATLQAGDYCGEMSLLTGEPRSATIVARTDCELWEIAKPVVAELLQKNEALVEKLGALLAQRRLEAEGVLASQSENEQMQTKKEAYTHGFMKKLYSFFEL